MSQFSLKNYHTLSHWRCIFRYDDIYLYHLSGCIANNIFMNRYDAMQNISVTKAIIGIGNRNDERYGHSIHHIEFIISVCLLLCTIICYFYIFVTDSTDASCQIYSRFNSFMVFASRCRRFFFFTLTTNSCTYIRWKWTVNMNCHRTCTLSRNENEDKSFASYS